MTDNKLTEQRTLGVKKVGIQGLRQQAVNAVKELDPTKCANRIGIGFDDSGSMGSEGMKLAKKAVEGFLQACTPQETSVCVFPYNADSQDSLVCIYDQINFYLGPIQSTGNTPLFSNTLEILTKEITRAILFTDGHPDYEDTANNKEKAILLAIERKIPFDCVYIGHGDNELLKEIAERTGGIYVHFDDTTTFSKQMKYLSPKYRALLMNADLKNRIQKGQTI